MTIALGCLLLAVVAFFGGRWALAQYHLRKADADLRAAIAEVDAYCPDGWQFSDLDRRRKPIGDDANGAKVVIEACSLLPTEMQTVIDDSELEIVPPPCKVPAELFAQIASVRIEYEPALKRARLLPRFESGRFPSLQLAEDGFSHANPCAKSIRILCRALALDALVQAEHGRRREASDAIIAAFALGRMIGDEPALMSQIARLGGRKTATDSLQRILALGVFYESDLARIQEAISAEGQMRLLPVAIRGEIAAQHDFYGRIERDELDPKTKKLFAEIDFTNKRLIVTQSHAYALRMLLKALACAEGPADTKCMATWEKHLLHDRGTERTPPLAAVMTPGLGKVWNFEQNSVSLLGCAQVALAAERFRLRHRRWPTDAQAIVNAGFLKSIPLDPEDGKPLRFRQAPDGIVIYAIGRGQTAYEGDLWDDLTLPWFKRAEERRSEPTEFRLWNVDVRKRLNSPPRFEDDKQP